MRYSNGMTGSFKLCKVAAVARAFIAFGTGGSTTVSAQTTAARESSTHSQRLEGSWLYTVSIPEPSGPPFVFKGVETYAAGGGYSEADQLSFTPGYLATAGHGGWKLAAERTFLLTYLNLTYLKDSPTGYSRVRQIAAFNKEGTSYRGSGDSSITIRRAK